MRIQNIYDVDILLDGLSIFNMGGTILNRARIYESVMKCLPTCELDLTVPTGFFSERSLVDGTKIDFSIKCDDYKINEKWSFRIYNVKKVSLNQQSVTLFLEGLIDFYQGYENGDSLNAKDTTSSMFTKIAGNYGLQPFIDNTNDSQLWVATNKNIYQFMNFMCAHGWVDASSGMFWCIDRYKNLLYKNITTLFRNRQTNIYTFTQAPRGSEKDKYFNYSFAEGSMQAGVNNLKNNGYGSEDIYFDFASYSWKKASSAKVTAESNLINISKELSRGMANNWYGFDTGNFHPQYYNALLQNKRVLSTYSTYVTLNCQAFQPYRLCQIVNFVFQDSQSVDSRVTALSGIYMIDAIRVDITTKSVTSMVELVMQGINGKSTTQETY